MREAASFRGRTVLVGLLLVESNTGKRACRVHPTLVVKI